MARTIEVRSRHLLEKSTNVAKDDNAWVIDIIKEHDSQIISQRQIRKVSRILREMESNKKCFDPLVVSLGPYHHGEEHLLPMERYKEKAVWWFISSGSPSDNRPDLAKTIYDEFAKVTVSQTIYEVEFDEIAFTHMMFLDGCFILYFMDFVLNKFDDFMNRSDLNQPFILSDIFLLENQIPYTVLKALIKAKYQNKSDKDIHLNFENFINFLFLPQHDTHKPNWLSSSLDVIKRPAENLQGEKSETMEKEPLHLLDILRSKLIGDNGSTTQESIHDYYFRSIMELKASGVKLSRSRTSHLKDIDYKEGWIYGELSIPPMFVDDSTKTRLLNLIAYEMSPDCAPDRTITSYICFLDSLIDLADDAKELRSKNILLNRLGSDKEVAKLFNELANNLMPNPKLYAGVMQSIDLHCKNRVKVRFAEMLHTHFSSPWTIIALLAATFIIVLTTAQTGYAIKDFYRKQN